jgi:L-cystine uptake protein TcyP (sodium:dicarboxylate symporter family)
MEMIDRVNNELSQQGLIALLLGPVRGTPYKVYASQAAGAGMSLWLFILTSIPARLIRFVLVTVFFHYALKVVNRKIAKQYNIQILVTGWTGFYLYYFFVMGVT